MKKVFLILMVLATIGMSSILSPAQTKVRRAALRTADSEVSDALTKALTLTEATWVMHYVNNLSAGNALVVMQYFGYEMDGYAVYTQLSPFQKLYAVMFFFELGVGYDVDAGTALLVRIQFYKEFFHCSNSLAGKLGRISLTSIRELLQEERREERKLQEEAARKRKEKEERERKAKLQRMRDDGKYVQKVAELAAKGAKLETWELKKAERICLQYGWEVPKVIRKRLRKEERKEWWRENGCVFGLTAIGAIASAAFIPLLILLGSTE